MAREITLDGGEITLLKKIGLSGTPVYGKNLVLDRDEDMEAGEFIDTLAGLIEQGYVVSNKVNIRTLEDVGRAFFRVDQSLAKELRDAINPSRRRQEERTKRPRRR